MVYIDVFRVVNFLLAFLSGGSAECDPPSGADKGVELAVGNWEGDGYWIPIAYYYATTSRRRRVRIGSFNDDFMSVCIRGYEVTATNITGPISTSVEICDPALLEQSWVQFRWLQTARHSNEKVPPVDVWVLDDVSVEYVSGNVIIPLLQDKFDSPTLK